MKFTQNCIDLFIQKIKASHGIDQEKLERLWGESIQESPPKVSRYIEFMKEERKKIREEEPNLKFGEISKRIGARWKEEKQKQPTPKKVNPYLVFAKEQRKAIKKEKPDLKFGEVSKLIGARWKERNNPPTKNKHKEEPPTKSIKEIIDNIQEYELKGANGEVTKVPLEWTPWLIDKELKKHNINPEDLVYDVETPPPSPGPEMEVYEEDECIDKDIWNKWNDWCQNYYLKFVKGKKTLEELRDFCTGNDLPVGPRNVMLVRLVEYSWYSMHHFMKRRRGIERDVDFYKNLLKIEGKFEGDHHRETEKRIEEIYSYLKFPSFARSAHKDDYVRR